MVSGFESALATLAFKVSVANAFGSDTIFLDEPEANADPKTAEKLFETISNIGGFKQMFIISHKPEVIDILFQRGNTHGYNVNKGKFTQIQY
jgi:DNA repair exonuclease SbcCD ATPase subunit